MIADNDITVTSATQSEEAVRAHFEPAEKPAGEGAAADKTEKPDANAKKETVAKPAAVAKPEEKAAEAEADSDKPDEQVSEAARTMRRNRLDVRKSQFQKEIDDLRRTKGDLEREITRLRESSTPPKPAAPAADGKKDDTTPRPADAAPEFKFPSFEEWQELPGNDAKAFADYTDARTDARYEFNERQRDARVSREQAATAARERAREFKAHEDTFRTTHSDYDDALGAVAISDEQLASPQWKDLKQLVAQAGKVGPAVMYHLAKSAEDLALLLASRSRSDLLQEFGAIRREVSRAATAAAAGETPAGDKPAGDKPVAAVTPPPKPHSSAPAPVTPVTGGAAPGRTLSSIAEDSDDADAYIESRGMGRLLKR